MINPILSPWNIEEPNLKEAEIKEQEKLFPISKEIPAT